MDRLTLDKAIEREKKVAERNRKDIEFIKEDSKKYDRTSNSIKNYENIKANDDLIKTCIKNVEYYEQLAEWLEELKRLRQETEQDIYERAYKDGQDKGFSDGRFLGYNKAIDDLLEDVNEMAIEVDAGTYTMKAIGIGLLEQIAEQLKAGGADE